MKKRQGFVSNSSSSSFVLQVDKIPETPKELEKYFKKFKYECFEPKVLTKKDLSEYAFKVMEKDSIDLKYLDAAYDIISKNCKNQENIKKNQNEVNNRLKDKPWYSEFFKMEQDCLRDIDEWNRCFYGDYLSSEEYQLAMQDTNDNINPLKKEADEKWPSVPNFTDKWCSDGDSKNEPSEEYKLVEKIREEVFHELETIPVIESLGLNDKTLISVYCQGRGEGWNSHESNGMYETKKEKWLSELGQKAFIGYIR